MVALHIWFHRVLDLAFLAGPPDGISEVLWLGGLGSFFFFFLWAFVVSRMLSQFEKPKKT